MNKLFGLFLLALACGAPQSAWAVNCFWVGGTGTWDSTATTHWAPTTGAGATGCQTSNAAPAAGDNITFDGSSGSGTVTPDGTIASIAFGTLTAGAFTGTLAFNTNNPNMSFTTVAFTGAGTRTINMGSGTWSLSGTGNTFDSGTTTGLTATYSNATIKLTGNTGTNRTINPGTGNNAGNLVVDDNTGKGTVTLFIASQWASMNIGAGTALQLVQAATTTVTGAFTMTGTLANPSSIASSLPGSNAATLSVGLASTIIWASVYRITRAGAGTLDATCSFNIGVNTSFTSLSFVPASCGGSGGGGRIIGG